MEQDQSPRPSPRRDSGGAARGHGRRRIQVLAKKCRADFASITQGVHKRVSEWETTRAKRRGEGKKARRQLPVAECAGGKRTQLEVVRGRIRSRSNNRVGFKWKDSIRRLAKKAFVPDNVSSDYWAYARWRFFQRISASVLSVYSTECMLRAVGVGAKRSLPTAAAFNWLLKDGIGKLGKLAIVARLGSQYDLELKKFRFLSTVICDISCGLEMLTPFSPKNFLVLASVGNMGKSVGLSIALATQPAFHKKFALVDNMADITAKSQAQHVVADTLGLGLALGMSYVAQGVSPSLRAALPVLSFPVLAAMDICLVHKELRAIDLRTLNLDRAQTIASHWIGKREVLGMGRMSKMENMFFLPFSPEGTWPLTVEPLSSAIDDVDLLGDYLEQYGKEDYILIPSVRGKGLLAKKSLRLVFSDSASDRDLIRGILQASYFRKLELEAGRGEGGEGTDTRREGGYRALAQQSKRMAKQNIRPFVREVKAGGWQTSPLLLFDSGYAGYVLDSDWRRRL